MAFNQKTNKPPRKGNIQGAKSFSTGGYPGAKVKGPDATSFSTRSGGANGTTGGASKTGAQYDTTTVSFNHPYSESGALGIVKRLHK